MDSPSISPGSRLKPPRQLRRAPLALGLALGFGLALQAWAQGVPLSPDKAFRFTARALSPETIETRFSIADGYYLYRDRIHISVEPAGAKVTVPALPAGKIKEDQFFGRVETYRGSVGVNLLLKDLLPGQKVVVVAESQGCADVGICYPPQVQRVPVVLPAANIAPTRVDEPPKKSWFN
jgi:thiol:disulfide interchange protein DsbD